MSNIAIVFWSGTGNTEAMADAVKAGAQEAGAEVSVFNASDFSADMVADSLSGKKIALFGSYGWGDGQWMRDWQESCQNAGVSLACECVIANDAPDDEAVVACKNLGAALV